MCDDGVVLKITSDTSPFKICMAPWKALSIKPNGDVGPDAQYEGSYGNIHQQELPAILSSDSARRLKADFLESRFGDACRSCQKKESTVGHSRRIFFDHTLSKYNPEPIYDLSSEPDIFYLDLNLSNKCNLKCRMCNSVSSSAWLADEKALLRNENRTYHRPSDTKPVKIHLDKVLETFNDPRPFRNLKYLALRGGEPLLEIENLKVLEKFVEWDLAKKITLDISTNGSVFNPEIARLFAEFQCTELYISVEGAGDVYSYIRGGEKFSLTQLERHLPLFRDIPGLTIIFAVTVSIYNIFGLDELWDWFENVRGPYDEINMTNAVVRPEYLNFQILPRVLKHQALARLEASGIWEGPHDTGRRMAGDMGKTLIRSSLQKEIFSVSRKKSLIRQFTEFNRDLDVLRQTDIGKTVPELAPLFDDDQVRKWLRAESLEDIPNTK